MLVGYTRCSTDAQISPPSLNALTALGVKPNRIYVDHGLTGANRARPGLREALAACRSGDTLVVTKLDLASGDQSSATLVGHIGPRPLNEDQEAIAKPDQEQDVDEKPRQPCNEAGNVNLTELRDARCTADRSQAAFIPVVKASASRVPTSCSSGREWPSRCYFLRITFATYFPCWIATGATPGSSFPPSSLAAARSPITNASG